MIDACDMTETAKALARKIFRIIGEAEAKAHDLPLDEVHFMKWERLIPLWTWWRLPLLLTAFTSKR